MYRIKQDKRSIQSIERLKSALWDLMHHKDFADISVVELVSEAQMGRATFYRNFDALEDILRLHCDETFEKLKKVMIQHYEQNDGDETAINRTVFIKPFLRFWDTHTIVIQRLIQAKRTGFIHDALSRTIESVVMLRAKADDELWGRYDYFIAARSGEALHVLLHWIKNEKDLPPDELADLVAAQWQASLNLKLQV
ncbi:TetR/AcrR family transcriptional regulator [Paenibacillus herberti]|uniref:HTH tetR-type domain-containing protein n=1 Tax=Paenibacillus herberti TaxID=1619309 RepID=A0A229NTT6_9BACL|nr:TetR/AcrR family transcriptional regulator [Paenibacillus herberti]OXM13310.1 hypothetical protein CGZ75_19765 [Paenibacillus herberti]